MVKKEWIFCLMLVLLLIPFTSAINQTDIDKGYNCLENVTSERGCEQLSLEEQIFTSLAIGKCTDNIINSSVEGECWAGERPGCQLETTSKAMLALDKAGKRIGSYGDWLVSQNSTADALTWYLQVETSSDSSVCNISYNNNYYEVEIGSDKKFSSEAGSCLLLSESRYWLRVSPNCYGTEFQISCEDSFSTNLLFREEGSATINVLGETSSSSSGGTTTEKVDSMCFQERGSCSYEGTLWAASVLDYLGKDVSKYMPYLVALKEENREYLPQSFLYSLTGNSRYSDELLDLRSPPGYWEESGDKFYDSALAVNFLQEERLDSQLSVTKEWFIEKQQEDGCWNNKNIKDTAFILYSSWPREVSGQEPGDGEEETVCQDVGYCLFNSECEGAGGRELPEHSDTCTGTKICCDTQKVQEDTCADLAGEQTNEICAADEYCVGGEEKYSNSASDVEGMEVCCIGGTCNKTTTGGGEDEDDEEEGYTCETNGGTCRAWECNEDEKEDTYYTCQGDDICCMPQEDSSGIGWWIWLLIILIILAGLGIIFKDKIKKWWIKMKSGKGKGKPGPRGPRRRPPSHPPGQRPPQGRKVPRRIMPKGQSQPQKRPSQRPKRNSKELDNVLGKLKEMGK